MRDCLTILPSFPAALSAQGTVVLTRKFISGIQEYQKHWGPKVQVLLEPGPPPSPAAANLDEIALRPAELPFDLQIVAYEPAPLAGHFANSAVVLLAAHYRQTPLAALCAAQGLPAIFTTELSLKTRLQILATQRLNPLVRARRILWLYGEERRQRRAIRQASGVQCNGTPTFEAYRKIARDPLLYFDSRVTAGMLADEETVQRKYRRAAGGEVLRLAFTGRLLAIKGADHLPAVAEELRRLGMKYELSICGGGELESAVRAEFERRKAPAVFRGVMDFERELMPFVRENTDLFVCCHRQGDPSCTYLETMSCGVPIAGYANQALAGIVRQSGAGWLSRMDRPAELAGQIARLSAEDLRGHALKALAFARQHTFEQTFARRAEQLRRLALEAAGFID